MERINNGNDGYLYCGINCNPQSYQDQYDSSEECFNDIKNDIIEDCKESGYNEQETNKVLDHYEISLNMANGEWKDIY